MEKEFRVSELKRQVILEEYLQKIRRGKKLLPNKHLTIITGLPGSGKSTVAAKIAKENKNAVCIGSDDFYALFPDIFELYKKYPSSLNTKEQSAQEHSAVESFINKNFEEAVAQILVGGENIILDTQPNASLPVYIETAQDLGYKVDVKFIAAPKRQIETNIVARHMDGVYRFEQALAGKRPRTGENIPHHFSQLRVPESYIREIKSLLRNINDSGADLEIINALNNEVLYSREQGGRPEKAFEQELSRPLTEKEKLRQKAALNRIRLIARRITLRRGKWKTTERPEALNYEAQTGHEKYYNHVIGNLER